MVKAAAYARYSTDHQCSTEIQLHKIGEYCVAHNLELEGVFVDEGLTGTNTDRSGFESMVASAKRGAFQCVVVYDVTRGSRDVADWFNFRKEMKRLDIRVLSTLERLGDISNPSDFLTELLTVGIGQHHVLTTRIKSMDKIAELAAQGKFCGGYAPLGYDVQGGEYIINEHEAIAVRRIFSMYAAGGSYSAIVDWLAAQGYRGKRGRPLGNNSIYEILRNERYIGRFTWNKRQVKYMSQWAGGKLRDDVVVIDDLIPRIIDEHTWGRVKLRMEANKRNTENKSRRRREYILSGLLHCAKCGGAFVGVTTTNKKGIEYKFYSCANKKRRRDCDAKNIAADDIEPLIVGLVKNSIVNGDMIERTADAILSAGSGDAAGLSALKKELSSLDHKIENLLNSIESGLDSELVHARLADNEVKRKALSEKIKNMVPKQPLSREYLIGELKKDAERIVSDPSCMKELLKKYIVRIDIDDETITIHAVCDLGGAASPEIEQTAGISSDGLNTAGCGGRI